MERERERKRIHSLLYNNMLCVLGTSSLTHSLAVGLWVMAAKFEFEELKDVFAARTLIQQGLRANSDSKHLWREVRWNLKKK